MFKVYRYEHPTERKGPYNCTFRGLKDDSVCSALHENHANEKHPSCTIDGLDFIQSSDGFLSACQNMRLLKKWFHSYNKRLLNSGFVIAEYTVKAKFDGQSGLQCVFHESAVIERKEFSSFPE